MFCQTQPSTAQPTTFDEDVQQSEMLRQGDIATATHRSAPDEPWGSLADFNFAVQAAYVAHYLRCLASARANGRAELQWLSALKSIGVDL